MGDLYIIKGGCSDIMSTYFMALWLNLLKLSSLPRCELPLKVIVIAVLIVTVIVIVFIAFIVLTMIKSGWDFVPSRHIAALWRCACFKTNFPRGYKHPGKSNTIFHIIITSMMIYQIQQPECPIPLLCLRPSVTKFLKTNSAKNSEKIPENIWKKVWKNPNKFLKKMIFLDFSVILVIF